MFSLVYYELNSKLLTTRELRAENWTLLRVNAGMGNICYLSNSVGFFEARSHTLFIKFRLTLTGITVALGPDEELNIRRYFLLIYLTKYTFEVFVLFVKIY